MSSLFRFQRGVGRLAKVDEQPGLQEERRLVRAMLEGDADAFDQFVRDYSPGLFRFAKAHLREDPESVQDMVQTTLAAAMEGLESFRGQGPLGAWLVGICRLQIAAYRRRSATRRRFTDSGVDDFDRLPDQEPSSQSRLELAEHQAHVHSALDLLPPPYGEVLQWKYLHDLPVREIASRLGLSNKAAESTLTRARNAFRKVFSQAHSLNAEGVS